MTVVGGIPMSPMVTVAFVHSFMQALGFFPAMLGARRAKEGKSSSGAENDRSFLHGMG